MWPGYTTEGHGSSELLGIKKCTKFSDDLLNNNEHKEFFDVLIMSNETGGYQLKLTRLF